MPKILGISLKATSVSMSLFDSETMEFIHTAVCRYQRCETVKNESLSKDYREKGVSRRGGRRKKYRRKAIAKILAEVFPDAYKRLRDHKNMYDLYKLRVGALDDLLFDMEGLLVLRHITARKRGPKFSRKEKKDIMSDKDPQDEGAKAKKKEKQQMLKGADKLKKRLKESKLRTIGEYLYHQPRKRNRPQNYDLTVHRDLLIEELDKIFAAQKKHGNTKFTQPLLDVIKENLNWEAPKQSFHHLVETCTFEPEEMRAAKHSHSFEIFKVLQDINDLRILDRHSNVSYLTQDQRDEIFQLCYELKSGVTYKKIRKVLGLNGDQRFNFRYTESKKQRKEAKKNKTPTSFEAIRENCEKKVFAVFTGWHLIRVVVENIDPDYWKIIRQDLSVLDKIANIVQLDQDEDRVKEELLKCNIPEDVADGIVLDILNELRGFGKLSNKACYRFNELLKTGMSYATCVSELYPFDGKLRSLDKLPIFESTNNPVVNRTIAKARKMLNAFIRKFGKPDEILIRVDWELPKSGKVRRIITKDNKERNTENEALRQEAAEFFGRRPNFTDFHKYRLWIEQNKYSIIGSKINPTDLKDPQRTRISYILPLSRSHNHSQSNMVLELTGDDKYRKELTIYEKWHNTPTWSNIEKIAKNLPHDKLEKIQRANFNERVEREWQDRSLIDSRHAVIKLKDHIASNLGVKVNTRRAKAISHLIRIAGIQRHNNDIDRGIEAMMTAISERSWMTKMHALSRLDKWTELKKYNPDINEKVLQTFREAAQHVAVVRSPNRKLNGPAHAETLMGIESEGDSTRFTKYIPLYSLTEKNFHKIVLGQKNPKDPLYKAIKNRYEEFKNSGKKFDGKKAFGPDNPLMFPSKGAIRQVHRIKIYVSLNTVFKLKDGRGAYGNAEIIRLDIYKINGQFLANPIYVHDLTGSTPKIPCRVLIKNSFVEADPKDYWCTMQKNDYIEVIDRKDNLIAGYYKSFDVSSNSKSKTIFLEHPLSNMEQKRDKEGNIEKDKNGNSARKMVSYRVSILNVKQIKVFTQTYLGEKFHRKSFKL